MKVIFLDVDGVLNEEKSRSRCCGYKGLDDKKAGNLAEIVKATGAEIVLISTWKDSWRKTNKAYQGMMANYLDDKLKKQGITVFDKMENVDKGSGFHLSRGEGILQYLSAHSVKKYVILDDYQFDYDSCELPDYYVKTDANNGGLTKELALQAIDILNA